MKNAIGKKLTLDEVKALPLKNLVHIARYYFDSDYRENYNRKLKFNRIIAVANNIIGGLK